MAAKRLDSLAGRLRRIRLPRRHEKENHQSFIQLTRSEPSDLPPFTYTHFEPGTMRLLVPDACNDPEARGWTFQIAHINDESLPFDALSYVWGGQADKFPIMLNGKRMFINRNLSEALPYLCLPDPDRPRRPIWIDALCINQGDEEEKSGQIAMMHKIYSRAERVWA
jgi:hypothetical protein